MKFISKQSKIRTIKQGDPLFTITEGFTLTPRAGFEISQQCPNEYRLIIQSCLMHGWLKPVAYITEEEQFIETLKL